MLSAAAGCSTLKLPNMTMSAAPDSPYESAEFPLVGSVSQQAYQGVRQAKAQHAVVLEVVGDSEPVRVLPLPQDRAVYVSNLLRDTGVTEKLGVIEATLFRQSAESIGGLPMEVRIAGDGQTVRPESDYALQAGDRLKVSKGTHPALKGLLGPLLGR